MSSSHASTSERKEEAWDFLKGSGPSSALYYYAPLSKEGVFKPGWNTKRPQASIRQDADRKSYEAFKEQRSLTHGEIRKERIIQCDGKNRFNPISHQSIGPDGSLAPATDAWQHQRVGIPAQEPRFAAADTLRVQADTVRRNVGITELRKDRIANGGLSKHPGGTMKEVLTWAGQ
ncbi:hypothetical protein VOLCADRAFT_105820 [Volvox carteri f. nagariensis]|uniref:Uncharacterized protein n=1 Tax=Volvox carteri f. nagariensis TaxID=3068 RepID=D8U3C6_VOLCA|nr:uncharacterized protein VOLCADRAFT_105820 [Volvox carteri f. nagariensis]EFJ45803.1 hypothetical protein VOLCADRAFT_105820 [Volvox carteri f. nagariensis]|eukprot:XP_002953204.1 hypothetical protein VOLCADRAFT_105820 [Volvox carteri f. nagariensis]